MNAGQSILILAASNRRHSNSNSIADYLAQQFVKLGCPCTQLELAAESGKAGEFPSLLKMAEGCRQVVLVSSVYHDTLNFTATSALEQLAAHAAEDPEQSQTSFGAVVHSGYPEPVHSQVALSVCRQFAREMGWNWLGGLSAGGTSPIGGRALDKTGGLGKNLRRALELAAPALSREEPIPEAAVRLAATPPLPAWLFKPLANLMMWRGVRKLGTRHVSARPFA